MGSDLSRDHPHPTGPNRPTGSQTSVARRKALTSKEEELLDAAKHDDRRDVHKIIQSSRVDVNASRKNKKSALHLACQHGCVGVIEELLLRADLMVNMKDIYGRTPLMLAKHAEVIKLLLRSRGDIDVNAVDKEQRSALFRASSEGYVRIVSSLLAKGEDINVNQANKSKVTPLMVAVYNEHVEVVKLLLTRPDVALNVVDMFQRTALDTAIHCNVNVVRLLLSRPDIHVNSKGMPLMYAFCYDHTKVAQLILRHPDADVNAGSALAHACGSWKRAFEHAVMLLRHIPHGRSPRQQQQRPKQRGKS